MSADLLLAAGWTVVLAGALAAASSLRRRDVPAADVRDALHVGAGVWVLGWPLWEGWQTPVAFTVAVASSSLLVPRVAAHSAAMRLLVDAVTDDVERWVGVSLYVVTFAVFTAVGLLWHTFAAGAALLALAWGDAAGGAIGRRIGRLEFRTPGGPTRTVEGSVSVAVGAALGVVAAACWFSGPTGTGTVTLLALTAAVCEAASPSSLDNAIVPLGVYLAALVV